MNRDPKHNKTQLWAIQKFRIIHSNSWLLLILREGIRRILYRVHSTEPGTL